MNAIGKCKVCKQAHRFTLEVQTREVTHHNHATGHSYTKQVRDVFFAGRKLQYNDWNGTYSIACPSGDSYHELWIKGISTFGGTQKCGARCFAATGPDCECQCHGDNHGQAHSAA